MTGKFLSLLLPGVVTADRWSTGGKRNDSQRQAQMATKNVSGRYRKLKKNRIRVLSVKYEDETLSGKLSTVTLPGEGSMLLFNTIRTQSREGVAPRTRWAALSYVWGDPSLVKQFTLNGVDILIHHNLYQALRHFCECGLGYSVWTDYICINQSDASERKRHLHMMDRIYGNAYIVFSYLGESNDHTMTAVQLLTTLHPTIQSKVDEFMQRDRSDGQSPWIGNEPWVPAILPPEDQRDGVGKEIFSLFYNDYFFRAWILQETVLARHQTVFRGSVEIDAGILYDYFKHFAWRMAILSTFYNHIPRGTMFQQSRFINPWPFVRTLYLVGIPSAEDEGASNERRWPEQRSMYKRCISRLLSTNSWLAANYAERLRGPDDTWFAKNPNSPVYHVLELLLYFTFDLECSLPEDRCLSLMGLLKRASRRELGRRSHMLEKLPEALDVKSVFVAFAMAMLYGRNGLVVLSWAAYSRHQEDFDLPSWCPNFHRMAKCSFNNIYYNFYDFMMQEDIEENERAVSYDKSENALSCRGIQVDVVGKCMQTTFKQAGVNEIDSIIDDQPNDLPNMPAEAVIAFLEEVWEYSQQAVRASPRVKQSYRDEIQRCSMHEAGISFMLPLMRFEEDLDSSVGMNMQLLIEYLQELQAIAVAVRENAGEALEQRALSLYRSRSDAVHMVGRLSRMGDQYHFVTESGYFGSATAQLQPGDLLVILARAKYPFILRGAAQVADSADASARWRLVAEAHVSELTLSGACINEFDPPTFWPSAFNPEQSDAQVEPEADDPELTGLWSTLRWQAGKPFKPEKIKIDGYEFVVPPIAGRQETFILV